MVERQASGWGGGDDNKGNGITEGAAPGGTGPDTTCTQRPNYILLQSQQANKH